MKRTLICLVAVATFQGAIGADLTYAHQFRIIDAFARVNTPTGQMNDARIEQANDYLPFHTQFSLHATKGSGNASLFASHDSVINSRGFWANLRAEGTASSVTGSSDNAVSFDHNIFQVVFSTNANSTFLLEARRQRTTSGEAFGINAIQILRNLEAFQYFDNDNGFLGVVFPIQPGFSYNFGTGTDITSFSSNENPSSFALSSSKLNCEIGTTVPSSFSVIQGQILSGGAFEVSFNDDVSAFNLCDEAESVGELEVSGSVAASPVTEMEVRWKSSSSHPNCLEIVRMLDRGLGGWVSVGSRIAPAQMTSATAVVTDPMRFVDQNGQVSTRVMWIPTEDLESVDGWANQLDFVRWNTH